MGARKRTRKALLRGLLTRLRCSCLFFYSEQDLTAQEVIRDEFDRQMQRADEAAVDASDIDLDRLLSSSFETD